MTQADMNELIAQRANWRYYCSVTCVTQQKTSSHENFSFLRN